MALFQKKGHSPLKWHPPSPLANSRATTTPMCQTNVFIVSYSPPAFSSICQYTMPYQIKYKYKYNTMSLSNQCLHIIISSSLFQHLPIHNAGPNIRQMDVGQGGGRLNLQTWSPRYKFNYKIKKYVLQDQRNTF